MFVELEKSKNKKQTPRSIRTGGFVVLRVIKLRFAHKHYLPRENTGEL